jgi:hypothetical protein
VQAVVQLAEHAVEQVAQRGWMPVTVLASVQVMLASG